MAAEWGPAQVQYAILKACTWYYGYDPRTPSRTAYAVASRQAAAVLLRDWVGLSYSEIGRILGKHPTTVLALIRRSDTEPTALAIIRERAERLLKGEVD